MSWSRSSVQSKQRREVFENQRIWKSLGCCHSPKQQTVLYPARFRTETSERCFPLQRDSRSRRMSPAVAGGERGRFSKVSHPYPMAGHYSSGILMSCGCLLLRPHSVPPHSGAIFQKQDTLKEAQREILRPVTFRPNLTKSLALCRSRLSSQQANYAY